MDGMHALLIAVFHHNCCWYICIHRHSHFHQPANHKATSTNGELWHSHCHLHHMKTEYVIHTGCNNTTTRSTNKHARCMSTIITLHHFDTFEAWVDDAIEENNDNDENFYRLLFPGSCVMKAQSRENKHCQLMCGHQRCTFCKDKLRAMRRGVWAN